jgi:signal peptidase I
VNECSVIRDLLPLYEDQAVSPETSKVIKAHLEQCPDCKDYFRHIKHVTKAMQDQNARNSYRYSDVVKRIRKKTIIERVVGALLLTAACYGLLRLAFSNRNH